MKGTKKKGQSESKKKTDTHLKIYKELKFYRFSRKVAGSIPDGVTGIFH